MKMYQISSFYRPVKTHLRLDHRTVIIIALSAGQRAAHITMQVPRDLEWDFQPSQSPPPIG